MKKLKIGMLCLMVLAVMHRANSQTIYYDAWKLTRLAKAGGNPPNLPPNDPLVYTVLDSYMPPPGPHTQAQIKLAFDAAGAGTDPNLFINFDAGALAGIVFASAIKSGIDKVGGVNVTDKVDGLTKFIIDRVKQELTAAFFERFKKDLENPDLADLKILFPETFKALSTIDKDVYQYTAYLNTLRNAFKKDLSNEYANLRKLIAQQKYKEYFAQRPVLSSVLYTSLYFTDEISHGVHPGKTLENYDTTMINFCGTLNPCPGADLHPQTNIRSSIGLIQELSQAFHSTSGNTYWVPVDSIRMLLQDETGFKMFMGLYYEKTKHVNFIESSGTGLPFKTVLNKVAVVSKDLQEYEHYIEHFAEKAQDVNGYIQEIKGKNKTDIDVDDYYQLFNASSDLLEHASGFIDLPSVDLGNNLETRIKETSATVIFISHTAGQLFVDVKAKNYSSAVLNTASLLDTILNFNAAFNKKEINRRIDENKADIDKYAGFNKNKRKDLLKAFDDETIARLEKLPAEADILAKLSSTDQAVLRADAVLKKLVLDYVHNSIDKRTAENKAELRNKVFKYGTFMAAVAQAQSSDEVQAAIESMALPAGSSRIKRETKFNVSLNAYCGLYLGQERGRINQRDEHSPDINSYGLAVPVGIGLNWGARSCKVKKNHASHSAFISLIDVGAVAAFRFQNDTVKTLSRIDLKDIVSPGIFYSFGIPKLPISINLGYQVSPLLHTVSTSGNELKNSAHRFSLSVLVDIPLLNFYTSPRKE